MRTSEKPRLNYRQLAERLNCTPAAVRFWTLKAVHNSTLDGSCVSTKTTWSNG